MKRIAGELASNLVERLARDCQTTSDTETLTTQLQQFVHDYSFIQYVYVTDVKGHSTAIAISDPGDQKGYKAFPIGFDYSNREWFQQPMRTGKLHIMNVHAAPKPSKPRSKSARKSSRIGEGRENGSLPHKGFCVWGRLRPHQTKPFSVAAEKGFVHWFRHVND